MFRLFFLLSFFLPALSYPSLPLSLRAAGQTLEPCQQDADCLDSRLCVDSDSLAPCPPNASCICIPPVALQPCSNSDDCEPGELCAVGTPQISYHCVSDRVVMANPQLSEGDASTDVPKGPDDGLTIDSCRTDLQCRDSRKCFVASPFVINTCLPTSLSCICRFPTGLQRCMASIQCPPREVCARGVLNMGNVCIAKSIADEVDDYERVDPPAASDGLTLDPCQSGADCKSSVATSRLCLGLDNKFCEGASASCVCIPFDGLAFCGDNRDCASGEVCAKGLVRGTQYGGNCMSSCFVDSVDSVEEYDGPGNGGTMLPCRSSGGCESDKTCADANSFASASLKECTSTSFPCLCAPKSGLIFCESSAECPDGEVCATNPFGGPACVSRSVIGGKGSTFQKVPEVNCGLTFDPCQSGTDCKSSVATSRVCLGLDNKFCEGASASCFCKPFVGLAFCGDNRDCASGEVCAKGLVRGTQYGGNCMSSCFVDSVDSVEEYDGPGNGGTMLPCRSSGGCESDKTCADANSFASASLKECTSTSFPCLCAPKSGLIFCESSAECPDGEACATNPFGGPACVSRSVIGGKGSTFVEIPGQSLEPGSTDDSDIDASPSVEVGIEPSPTDEVGIEPSPLPLEFSEASAGPLEGEGFTLDACVGNFDVVECQNRRECFSVDSDFGLTTELCSVESDECVCAPRRLRTCTSSADCVVTEMCATGFPLPVGQNACVSKSGFSEFAMQEVQDGGIDISPSAEMSNMILESPTEEPIDMLPSPSPAVVHNLSASE